MDTPLSTEISSTQPEPLYPSKPEPIIIPKGFRFKSFLTSAFLFCISWYFFVNDYWQLIAWLATILFIHELGHYLAMKFFKYEDLSIFFIPLVGAAAGGTKEKISQKEKAIVLLAGPVPGIIIGLILYLVGNSADVPELARISYAFVILNLFNLLPIYPLDGGQLFRTLFMPTRDVLSAIFILVSVGLITWYAIDNKQWFLLMIPGFLLIRLIDQFHLARVRIRLKEAGIDYNKTYADLTDEEYWLIRDELSVGPYFGRHIIAGSREISEKEKIIMNTIRRVLRTDPARDIFAAGITLIIFIWIAAVAAPLLLMDRIWNLL